MIPCDRCRAPIGRDWPKVRHGSRVVCWQCAESLHLAHALVTMPPDYEPPEPPVVANEADAGVALRVGLGVVLVGVLVVLAWLRGAA